MDFKSKYKGSEIEEILSRSRASHVTRELNWEVYGTEMRDILPADLGNDVIVTWSLCFRGVCYAQFTCPLRLDNGVYVPAVSTVNFLSVIHVEGTTDVAYGVIMPGKASFSLGTMIVEGHYGGDGKPVVDVNPVVDEDIIP